MQNVQYTQVQKTNQYNSSYSNSAGVVYARVQKESAVMQQSSPDPWAGGPNKGINLGLGPPPSLAEQLKQVSFVQKPSLKNVECFGV